MTFRTPVAFSLTLLLGQSHAFAASTPLELKWTELNAAIYGQTVELTLPGAFTVKGDVAAVRDDALVLDVRKTSDAKAFPKGNAVIPRSSVTLLKLEKHGRTNWHTMGTVIGVLSGVVLGGYIAGTATSQAGPALAVFLTTASAISVAGYAAGHAAEKKTTMIRIAD